jgi:hypothetical protein
VFENVGEAAAVVPESETRAGLAAYIAGCMVEDARIRETIERALGPGERMIVWGTGTHTLRLLATNGLDPARIALFVDSNVKYQQQELRGIAIVGPEELRTRSEPILISSRSSQGAIRRQIREGMGLKNRLILLYGQAELDTRAGGHTSLERA